MRYLTNIIQNLIPLLLFLYGVLQLGPAAGTVLTVSLVLYGLLLIVSLLLPFIPAEIFFIERMSFKKLSGTINMVSKIFDKNYATFNFIEDIIIVGIFAYFGFNLLAAAYAIHILTYAMLFHNVKIFILEEFSAESWSKVPKRLKEALDRGDTLFSFYELMDLKHPLETTQRR